MLTRRQIKIVPEASAVLKGYPNLSLHEDHKSMCRYDEKDNESYQKVKGVLSSWVEALQKPRTTNAASEASYIGHGLFTQLTGRRAMLRQFMRHTLGNSMAPPIYH